jgi:hypothetical protein
LEMYAKSVARKWLVETVIDCVCVSDLQSAVPNGVHKWSINPFINPYPVYSHP